MVDKIPASDILLILGDFNARVGSSVMEDDTWDAREIWSEAGERFLEFCRVNNFTIMNTWFSKKTLHLAK